MNSFNKKNLTDTPTNLPNSEPLPWFSIDYTKLFQMFTFNLHTDQYTLLFYMLLHRNQHFKMFILSRLNIDLLVSSKFRLHELKSFSLVSHNSKYSYLLFVLDNTNT